MKTKSTATLSVKSAVEKSTFKPGDTVTLRVGTRRVRGEVVEDRGPIGGGGRRLYDVRYTIGSTYSEPQYVELTAADLQKA